MGPSHVEVKPIDFPKLELDSRSSPVASERQKRKCEHGVILKVLKTFSKLFATLQKKQDIFAL
jgi:hypothetical protein